MVFTEPLAAGLAVQVAEQLTPTDQEVTAVGAVLAALSVVGVLVAALLGWAAARAGLAPITRLAGVAEEVSLTGDPGRRVDVGRRRDEVGRLATAFNAMLGALQRSLDAQRRLVSDASHELRTPAGQPADQRRRAVGEPGPAGRRPPGDPGPGHRPGDGTQPPGGQRDRPGPGRAAPRGPVPGPAQRRRRRRPGGGQARLAEDGVHRLPGRGRGRGQRRPAARRVQEPAGQRGQVRPGGGAGAAAGDRRGGDRARLRPGDRRRGPAVRL